MFKLKGGGDAESDCLSILMSSALKTEVAVVVAGGVDDLGRGWWLW